MTLPNHIFFGADAWGRLIEVLRENKVQHVLVVRGTRSYGLAGAAERVSALGREFTLSEHIVPTGMPTEQSFQSAARRLVATRPNAIVAIGGGSVLDTAKGARWLAFGPQQPSGPTPRGGLWPICVAVPTTAGSGSEVTPFATFYRDGIKRSLDEPGLAPDYVVVDTALTASLPPYQTACSGADAACQCIEAIWARAADSAPSAFALEGLALIARHLTAAVRCPTPEARAGMARASLFSGLAIARTRTTAVHAYSYMLTAWYGVPHGHAVALFMGPILELHEAVAGEPAWRGRQQRALASLAFGGEATPRAQWEERMAAWGLPTRLRELRVSDGEILRFLRQADAQRLGNHPIAIEADHLATKL